MSGPGAVDFENLWNNAQARKPFSKAIEIEKNFVQHMLSLDERKRLARLAPDTAYVMGV